MGTLPLALRKKVLARTVSEISASGIGADGAVEEDEEDAEVGDDVDPADMSVIAIDGTPLIEGI